MKRRSLIIHMSPDGQITLLHLWNCEFSSWIHVTKYRLVQLSTAIVKKILSAIFNGQIAKERDEKIVDPCDKENMAAKDWLELFKESRKCFILCTVLLLFINMLDGIQVAQNRVRWMVLLNLSILKQGEKSWPLNDCQFYKKNPGNVLFFNFGYLLLY